MPMLAFTLALTTTLAAAPRAQSAPDDERAWLAAIQRGLAAGASAARPEGRARITGRVLAPSGAGLAGVTVRLSLTPEGEHSILQDPLERSRVPAAPSLVTNLEGAARRWAEHGSRELVVLTDERGAFAVESLPRGSVNTWGYLDGWWIRPRGGSTLSLDEDESAAHIDFEAQPIHEVPLGLRMPDGAVPEAAWVIVDSEFTGRQVQAWSRAKPRIAVVGERAEVIAHVEPLFPLDSWDAPIVARFVSQPRSWRRQEQGDLSLSLAAACGVYGRVIDVEGRQDGRSADVTLQPEGAVAPFDPQTAGASTQPIRLATANGRFGTTGLPSGRYTLSAEGAAPVTVTIAEGLVRQDLVVRRGELGRELLVQAVDGEGRPVELHDVQVDLKGPTASSWRVGTTFWENPAGGLWVAARVEGTRGIGDFVPAVVIGSNRRLGTVRAPITSMHEPIVLRFQPPAEVRVRLAGLEHLRTTFGAQVTLQEHAPERSTHTIHSHPRLPTEALTTEDDGCVVLESLQPGAYELGVTIAIGEYERQELVRVVRDLTPGRNEVTLAIPALSDLTLSLPTLAPGAFVRLIGEDEHNGRIRRNGVVDADWTITFRDLVHGRYRVIEPNVLERNHPSPLLVAVPAPSGMVTLE